MTYKILFAMHLPTRPASEVTILAEEINQTFSSPQNSSLRSATRNPVELSANWLVDTFPNLRATHITLGGTIGALAVSAVTLKRPETARAGSWFHLASSLSDAWDGPVARIHSRQNEIAPTLAGSLVDTGSDRVQEFAASAAQAAIAFKKGNALGGYAQLAFAATSVLPSLSRSVVESRGNVVSEGTLGSRYSRVTLNCLGYFWGQRPSRVVALGMIGTGLNVYNTATRLAALREGSRHNRGVIEPVKQQQAKSRQIMLGSLAAVGGVIAYKIAKAR